MPIELVVGLTALATKAIVADLIQGAPMTRGSWGDVAGQVAEIVINSGLRQESGLRQFGQRLDRVSGQIDQVSRQIDQIPMREFDQHMAAGRRYLRDLPVAWRTDRDRRDLIRDARAEFVQAVAIAELGGDLRRQALAEVSIAGCWLWVPSIDDVRNAAGQARRLLEREILFGAYQGTGAAPPFSDYSDVVKLCKAYGERSAEAAVTAFSSPSGRLTVFALLDRWVECADVWVHVKRDNQPPAAKPPPAVTARPLPPPQLVFKPRPPLGRPVTPPLIPPSTRRLGAGNPAWATGQPRSWESLIAPPEPAPVPSEPPTVLIVTVRNKRAAQVRAFFSPTAALVATANVDALSWIDVPPGEAKAQRVSVGSAADAEFPGYALSPRWALREAGRLGRPGVVAFQYPTKL